VPQLTNTVPGLQAFFKANAALETYFQTQEPG
jgi:hypothetical protein